jgi:UPF0271 protein
MVMPFCLYNRPLTMRLDINADVGESFGAYSMGHDAGLMRSITSASIAAGFHGGDPSVLRNTIRLAKEMRVTPEEAEDFVLYQVAAVAGVALAGGTRLRHVKPHGALYHMAARDPALAAAIARGVAAIDRSLILYGLPDSELLKAGRTAGLRVAAEGFADRAYAPDGSLAARSRPGSVIHEPALVVSRAIRMVKEQLVIAIDGSALTMRVDTICVHGDTPGADNLAAELRAGLESAGVAVQAIGDRA